VFRLSRYKFCRQEASSLWVVGESFRIKFCIFCDERFLSNLALRTREIWLTLQAKKGKKRATKRSPAKDNVSHRGLTQSLHSALCPHCESACMTTMTTDDWHTAKCQFIQAVLRHLRAFDVCPDCGVYRLFQVGYFLILLSTNNISSVGAARR